MIQFEKLRKNYEEEFLKLYQIADILDINISVDFKKKLNNNEFVKLDLLLEEIYLKIQSEWTQKNYSFLNKFSKTPRQEQINNIQTINGLNIPYSYERCFLPEKFEHNLMEKLDFFESRVLLYSSGMSAILAVVLFLNTILKNKDNIVCYFFGGYFETIKLFANFSSIHYVNSLEENIEIMDVIYIEPIKYDLSMEVVNIKHVVDTLKRRKSKKPLFVIFDTTLHGNSFKIRTFLEYITNIDQIIVINLRSLLKLHQEGLGFAHAGVLELFTSVKVKAILERFYEILKTNRWVCSLSPTPATVSLLDFKGFSKDLDYCMRILENNMLFYNQIKKYSGKGLIEKIIFPSGSTNEICTVEAPFVFVTIKNPSIERLQLVVNFLISNSKEIIYNRQSFGFRNTSIDYFITSDIDPKYIIKIAIGRVKGLSYYNLIDSIEVLSDVKEYSSLL